jgi:2-methylisocitrate lyase-like PEP mutase family enzyme
MSRGQQFRDLLRRGGLTIAPGAYDCITARSIAQAGFGAVYMTGAGTAATLGYPDYGLLTMSEMADNAGRIAASVDVPVIADADTGYGNELNATRTVREYERRGAAGLHIEDQGFPKRCGHLDNKAIVLATRPCGKANRRTPCGSSSTARWPGASAGDVILAIITRIGTAGGAGRVIEYAGSTIQALRIERVV